MRILHVEPEHCGPEVRAILAAVGEVDYVAVGTRGSFEAALAAAPYEAVFVRLGIRMDASAFDVAPRLRWIVTPTTGLDHIDMSIASARGTQVISLRGRVEILEHVTATAELTWGLLLALVRRIPAAHSSVLAGEWDRTSFLGSDLHGKTLGVLGCGRLGRMVARYGLSFGMRVLVHDMNSAALTSAPSGVTSVDLDSLLSQSDILSIHLPLDSATWGFLNADRIARMKAGAVLVNTARGELVSESALCDALDAGRLAGAAVDVLADDSSWPGAQPSAQRLVAYAREHHNVIITPHIGGYASEAIALTRRSVAQLFVDAATATVTPPR